MFRKIATSNLSQLRKFSSLTRTINVRANPIRLPISNQRLPSLLLSQAKISPYAFLHTQTPANAVAVELESQDQLSGETEPIVEKARFDANKAIHANTQMAIKKVFKYEEMSTVQDAVLSKLPNTNDMFVKAKTGTGKTLAFLIGAIETAIAGKSEKDLKYSEGASILVISPTRELASQIADEAQKLVSYYPFKVHCLVGGDSKRRQIMNMERRRCDIVVATPGRLHDMLSTVPRFKKICESLKVLVLDEADQLLDMGFKAELQRILRLIPEERQTMLFSATISKEIRNDLGNFALSPNYDLIDTVGKDDVSTNLHVKQSAIIAPYKAQLSSIRQCLETNPAANSGKVIVFLPTTKATMAYANIFKQLMPNRTVYEIHSKKGQDQRSRIADRFRKSKDNSILFTSDVSARGVDYPGVSLVLQVGVPSTREQYIHRLGRTGRAGREGEGIIFLAPFEKSFLTNEVKDLPITEVEAPLLDEQELDTTNALAATSLGRMDDEMVRELYTAYLGYYSGRIPTLGQPKSTVLKEAAKFMNGFGIEELPHLSPRFLTQLGLGGNGNGGSRSGGYSRDRSSSDRFSRSYNDRGDRPPRSFGDRPPRSFGDRPPRSFDDRSDRPPRSFGDRSDRPPRSFDDRPPRSFGDRSDRPPRSFGDRSDRPPRSFGDRPPRSFGDRNDRPRRPTNDRNDRPSRSYSRSNDE